MKRGSTPAGQRVVYVLAARFMESRGIDLGTDAVAMERLTEVSERVAREIKEKGKAKVNIPFIAVGPSGPVHLDLKLKKEDVG